MLDKTRTVAVAVAATVAAATLATPLLAAPADTIRARVAGYRALGAAFKSANDALRSGQTAPIANAARQIQTAAQQQYHWFPRGSAAAPGVRSHAKAEIWSQGPRFKAAQDAFAAQAAVFQRAAGSGNVALIRGEARKLGATCKGCHDSFRVESD